MEHKIKMLAEAITNGHTKSLVQTHVKWLDFDEDMQHLVIFVDNAGPLHEFSDNEAGHHLKTGLEKIYGEDITYELKLHADKHHEREKAIPHNIRGR